MIIVNAPEEGPIRDYRLTVRIRNNRLLTHIERTGALSIKAFCDAHKLSYQGVAQLVRMERPVYRISAGWTEPALQLSRILGQPPEELFRGKQLLAEFHTRKVERTVDEEQIVSISESSMLAFPAFEPDPETVLINKDIIGKLLDCLTERERIVVKAAMGIDGPKLMMDEIAKLIPHKRYGAPGRQRTYQIFNKAISRMRRRAYQLHLIPGKQLSEKAAWLDATKQGEAAKDDKKKTVEPQKEVKHHWWYGTPFHWYCVPCGHDNPGNLTQLEKFVFCEACGARHNNTAWREPV